MNRTIKKQFWFSKTEAEDLQLKAQKTCLTEAALVRLLIKGYEPRESPDKQFYEAMNQLSSIGNNINQLAVKANSLGFIDTEMLRREATIWHEFQSMIEKEFLSPTDCKSKWQ